VGSGERRRPVPAIAPQSSHSVRPFFQFFGSPLDPDTAFYLTAAPGSGLESGSGSRLCHLSKLFCLFSLFTLFFKKVKLHQERQAIFLATLDPGQKFIKLFPWKVFASIANLFFLQLVPVTVRYRHQLVFFSYDSGKFRQQVPGQRGREQAHLRLGRGHHDPDTRVSRPS
jgi:hypothetical protein